MTERQRDLFDGYDPVDQVRPIEPVDPNVHPDARKRLTRQSRIILEILRAARDDPESDGWVAGPRGPLNDVTPRYGGRIKDLRAAGYVIEMKQPRRRTGQAWYRLVGEPGGLTQGNQEAPAA